jgi:Zn-dependent peptidase ImmA (M78 family)/transcriptional regulator with XRE-family HTH domain
MALSASEIGRRLRQVREETGIPLAELATALGVDEATAAALEAGSLDPLPGDYVLIAARLLNTDFRYFISEALDDVEDRTRRLFRALSNLSPADLLAIRRFLALCLREQELEAVLDMVPRALPPTYFRNDRRSLHKDQGLMGARAERLRLLPVIHLPIPNIFEVLRSQGIRVFRHRLRDTQLSGLTVLHPKAGVCVLINYDDDLYRQFFSAAHEYGHVLFDRTTIEQQGHIVSHRKYGQSELQEFRCNSFAAEFLLPSIALQQYERPHDIQGVAELLRRIAIDYRVNTETVAITMRDEHWISQRTLESFQRTRPVTIPRSEKSDPDLPPTLTAAQVERRRMAVESGLTTHYLELLRQAFSQGQITAGRFAEMLDMDPTQARQFAFDVGLAV